MPYALMFSADLVTGYYCYAACTPAQTYRIRDRLSAPIRLAALHGAGHIRAITFDRRTNTLTDDQVMGLFGGVVRHAQATCRVATFREPVPLPGD